MASTEEKSTSGSGINLIALILGLIVITAMGFRTISNVDFYTHLATGKAIATAGVGSADTLSFTIEGKEWVKPNWLYDRIMSLFGASAVTTIVHLLAVVGAFVLLVPVVRKWSCGIAIGTALIVTAWLLAPRFEPRATLFALIFPALFVHVLEKKKLPNWMPFAILVPAQILWANVHTSFLMGPIIIALYIVEANFRGKVKDRKARITRLAALAGACLVAPIINPNLVGLYGYVTAGWQDSMFSSSQFWVSPILDEFLGRSNFPVINVILAVGACGLVFYREKLPLAATLLALVGAIIIVVFRRYEEGIELFTILLFPFLCLSLQSIANFLVQQGQNMGKGVVKMLPLAGFALAVILGVVTLISVVSNSYYIKTGSLSKFGLGANKDIVSSEAMEIINGPDFPERFLNLPVDGSFIAYETDNKKVFVDQRARLYGRDTLQQCMKGLVAADAESAQVVYDKWQPEAIVINTCAPNAEEIALRVMSASNWSPAYFDGTTLIVAAKTGSGSKLLDNKDVQMRGLEIFETARKSYKDALGSMVAAPLPARLIGGASMLMIFKQYKEAAAIYELLAAGAPTMHTPLIKQGICNLQMDKPEEAIRYLLKATEMAPEDATGYQWLSLAYEKNDMPEQAKVAKAKAEALMPATDLEADEEDDVTEDQTGS